MNSEFDLSLLTDSVLAHLAGNPAATKDSSSASAVAAASTDWLLFSASAPDTVPAPHPDLFESELDSLLFDTDLSSLTAYPSLDFDPTLFHYRSPAPAAPSSYSGYGPSTITASSESLSAYGSTYEPSLYSPSNHSAVSALLQDIDLSAFTLSGLQPEENMLPHYLHVDSDQDVKPSTSQSYYPTSPSAFQPSRGLAASAASATTAPGQTSANQIRAVPVNANSSLIGSSVAAAIELQSETDPRKKYQCPTCPRAFARAFNLKTHMATHDPHRVKAFQCPHSGCGRSFSRKHDLGRHLVSIHQDNSVAGSATVAAASGSITRGTMPAKSSSTSPKLGRHGCECDHDGQVH